MNDTFQIAALTLILQQPWLMIHERQVMHALLAAARAGTYADELARMSARGADYPLIIQNVASKCRANGLQPVLEHLKAHYDHRTKV